MLEILKKGMGDFWQKVMIHVYLQIKTKQLHLLSSRDFSSLTEHNIIHLDHGNQDSSPLQIDNAPSHATNSIT